MNTIHYRKCLGFDVAWGHDDNINMWGIECPHGDWWINLGHYFIRLGCYPLAKWYHWRLKQKAAQQPGPKDR